MDVRRGLFPLTARFSGRSDESVRGAKVREVELSALITDYRMSIEVYARWDGMSMQEAAAQLSSKCNVSYGIDAGCTGYLREPYYGEPYPTRALAPEAFRYGRARIAAADLQKRLPDALYMVETRELCFGSEAAVARIQEQYRDFVALCARKEQECGIPCMIIAKQ